MAMVASGEKFGRQPRHVRPQQRVVCEQTRQCQFCGSP
jgi:hypothetical protein